MAKILSKIIDITSSQQVGNVGLPVNGFTGGAYLASTDFPNTTTLYGWRAPATDNATWAAIYGGKDLTRTGALDVTTDYLGNTGANTFTPWTDWLYSTDAVFSFTGSFSFGAWVYLEDWSKTASFIGKTDNLGVSGWGLISSSGFLKFYQGATIVDCGDVRTLSKGWHYLVFVRNSLVTNSLYIDGVLWSKTVSSAITSPYSRLEIATLQGGLNGLDKMQDIWIHNATAWTDAQVQALYIKGSPAYKNQQYAGHTHAVVEPNRTAAETLAVYNFPTGANFAKDLTTNAYDLNVGTVTEAGGIFGGISGAANFTGANYLTQPTLWDTTPTALAISCWLKLPDGQTPTGNTIFAKWNDRTGGSFDGIYCYVGSDGKIGIDSYANGTNKFITSLTIIPNGQTGWYHIAVTWNTINGLALFVNGILEIMDSTATTLMSNGIINDFCIGVQNGGGLSSYFTGQIANIVIQNKVLTQADVDMLYSTKIAIPTALQNKDFLLEAKVQPKGVAAFEHIENMSGLVVAKEAGNVFVAGCTQGFGLRPSDKVNWRGRF